MTSETDAEFVERISRAIYDSNSTHKDADLIRLFALARRGAAVQTKPAFTDGHCEHKKAPHWRTAHER